MRMNEEIIERLAYRLIRIEVRKFDRAGDVEVANYVRGVVDLQSELYDELNRVIESEVESEKEIQNDHNKT